MNCTRGELNICMSFSSGFKVSSLACRKIILIGVGALDVLSTTAVLRRRLRQLVAPGSRTMSPSADDTYNVVPPPREPSDRNGHGHDSRKHAPLFEQRVRLFGTLVLLQEQGEQNMP